MDLRGLNPPQLEAVTHTNGPLLVLAGAGSGKTRVITHRIAHLIERGVDPRHIAALTFTNKAAAEMRERVGHLVGNKKRAAALTMGTFHSLGLQILHQEKAALGFPRGFVIYDTADQMGVVRELLRYISADGDRRFDVRAILTRISLAKNAFVAPEEFMVHEGDDYDLITAEIYPRYQEALRAFAAVDFDDLITEAVRLLRDDPAVGDRWRSAFRYVMVDEYQDTNRAQLLLVKQLAHHGNVCAVGDDDQSIYSWRGANPENILGFERDFAAAKVVVLDQNYRSTPTILSAANAVIANNSDRRGKNLWSAKPDGPPLCHMVADGPEAEAKFVAEEINRLIGAGERRYSDVAILYRSNIQTRELEEAMRTRRVPYVMFGGQQFFERKEVKDLIAYLRVALSDRDEISLRRIVNYPARGIGASTLERLSLEAQAEKTTLWRAVEAGASGKLSGLRSAQVDALAQLVAAVAGIRATVETQGAKAAIVELCERIDLYGDLRSASPSLTAAQRRIDNVETLARQLAAHEEKKPGKDKLLEYLRHLSLASDDSKDGGKEAGDKVVMTTLHGAKGLEFPVVFLVGAEEELLPHARSLMPHSTDVADPDHVSDVSEERRLAYVGITRAQEMLYVSRCAVRRRHGRDVVRTPSRFLLEIPAELCEVRDVALESREAVAADELSAFFQKFAQTE